MRSDSAAAVSFDARGELLSVKHQGGKGEYLIIYHLTGAEAEIRATASGTGVSPVRSILPAVTTRLKEVGPSGVDGYVGFSV